MNITIRAAATGDATLIADLSRQTFYETFAPHNSRENMDKFLAEQFTRGRLMMEVGQPGSYFFLAYAGPQVAGYVKLRDNKSPAGIRHKATLEIARIYVVQSFIGTGVGKALMQQSIDKARQLQKKSLWLGVWEHNGRAIAFYTSLGFNKFGEQDFLLGDDVQKDWLMEKTL